VAQQQAEGLLESLLQPHQSGSCEMGKTTAINACAPGDGMTLPPFDDHGNLPSGDYWPTEADFEGRFVNVAGSSSRENIYAGFKNHRAELLAAGVDDAASCMLDGSYTTSKLDPGDIDLVVEVDAFLFQDSERL